MSYSLEKLYCAVGTTRQAFHGYLDRFSATKGVEEQVLLIVLKIRQDHPEMGVREMYFKIMPQGMGRDAFEDICRDHSLMVQIKKNFRRTTDSSNTRFFPNFLEGTVVDGINQIWQSDITYFEVNNRFCFITLIQDAFSKIIVGHHASEDLSTESTTLPSLKMAIQRRKGQSLTGLTFHSDGGGQYYQKEFIGLTQMHNIRNSMGRSCYENAMAESLNGVIKNKYLVYRNIKCFQDLRRELDRTVQLYNNDKPHSALQRMTPESFEKSWYIEQAK